jgi:predicted DNA-binding transcriptional regulator YafY
MVEVDEYIARNLRPRQDGSASLVFRCPTSELDYYARFFAGLGPEVRVLAPQELRARLRALGELLEKTYPPE